MLLLPALLLLAHADTAARVSVRVDTSKANGDGWDIGGGAPDIGICVITASNNLCDPSRSGVCSDKFKCSYDVVIPSGPFTVVVYDIDTTENDRVGSAACKGKGDNWTQRDCDVSGSLVSVSISR